MNKFQSEKLKLIHPSSIKTYWKVRACSNLHYWRSVSELLSQMRYVYNKTSSPLTVHNLL